MEERKMKATTVEARIKDRYDSTVVDFFQSCINDGMETHEIAKLIDCSVSNLRRIARKYKFTFYQPEPTPMFSENSDFKNTALNMDNFLSRSWVKATA
tara:strand:+ start:830 stop:1123 length:294 start_codon:yes stop_codon:yes gene_type:complete